MLDELAISTVMVLLTVIFHGTGLMLLSKVLRMELREEAEHPWRNTRVRALVITIALVLGLFVLHAAEIWAYAVLYLQLEALPHIREAVYFSTISYSTTGYDDDLLAEQWRLVAAIEGMNGVLLMGWSTAFFVTGVTRLMRR